MKLKSYAYFVGFLVFITIFVGCSKVPDLAELIVLELDKPQNLFAVESVSGQRVCLSWSPVYRAKKYLVLWSDDQNGEYNQIQTSSSNYVCFSTADVDLAGKYYKVQAKAGETLSEESESKEGIYIDNSFFVLLLKRIFLTPLSPTKYADLGNGVIKDNATNLFWQKCSMGQSGADCATGSATTDTWGNAKDYCAGLDLGGRTNWRLPEINELLTLVDYNRSDPAINPIFPATVANQYWSNTVDAGDPSRSWNVYFNYGYSSYDQTNTFRARCVAK